MNPQSAAPVKYVAVIHPVREVALLGTADLDWWRQHLAPQELAPYSDQGRASILVSAIESKFLGVRFREMIVSVFVSSDESGTTNDGAYLVSAFNTSRVFSWVERTAFRTPYRCAAIDLQTEPAESFGLIDAGRAALSVERRQATPPVASREQSWDGTIYLPGPPASPGGPSPKRQRFFAKIAGLTEVTPFSPADDLVRLDASQHPVVQHLRDSHFAGTEWQIRRTATHARSKTYTWNR